MSEQCSFAICALSGWKSLFLLKNTLHYVMIILFSFYEQKKKKFHFFSISQEKESFIVAGILNFSDWSVLNIFSKYKPEMMDQMPIFTPTVTLNWSIFITIKSMTMRKCMWWRMRISWWFLRKRTRAYTTCQIVPSTTIPTFRFVSCEQKRVYINCKHIIR